MLNVRAAAGDDDGAAATPMEPVRTDALTRRLEAEQERWFLWLPVMFGSGVAAYFSLGTEPGLVDMALLAAAALVIRTLTGRHTLAMLAAAALLAATLGGLAAKLRTEYMRSGVIERQIGSTEVRGWIELVEPRVGRGQRLTLQVISMSGMAAARWPYRVRVRTLETNAALRPGMAVRLRATLAGPAAPSFPGDFDFARLAWFQALGGIGLATGRVALIDDAGPPPLTLEMRAAIERLRQSIGQRITAALPGETGAIATALITGERGAITEATNQAYRDSGLFHILSISGLHMVIMAGAVFAVLRLAFAAVPAIALRYPIKKWAAFGAILGALGYLTISGAAFATVRSAIMITIMFTAVMLDRPALALRNVALAALLILVVFPESLFDAGFQMSFAAVVALISAYEYLRVRRAARGREDHDGPVRRLAAFAREIMLSTIIASLAVAPFGVYHFHNTQQLALLANLIAIPICNIVVMPAALAVLVALPFGLEAGPLWIMGLGIDAMTAAARAVAVLPGAVVRVPAIPSLAFALMIAGGLWLLLWAGRWRLIGLLAIIAGLIIAPTLPRPVVLVGREATTVAVRGSDGVLSAIVRGSSRFELARWLEADGDRRPLADVATARAFRCDPLACHAEAAGLKVVVAHNPAALREDCAGADILVLRFTVPASCRAKPRDGADAALRRPIVIDPSALAAGGAHAIFVGAAGRIGIETVAHARGTRPWSEIGRTMSGPAGSRILGGLAGFIAGQMRTGEPPSQIEDEVWPGGRPAAP